MGDNGEECMTGRLGSDRHRAITQASPTRPHRDDASTGERRQQMVQAGTSTSLTCASRPTRLFGRSPTGHPTVTIADPAGCGAPYASLALHHREEHERTG